jgi:hypothetical protein
MQGRASWPKRIRRLADDSPEIEYNSSHGLLECNLEEESWRWRTVVIFWESDTMVLVLYHLMFMRRSEKTYPLDVGKNAQETLDLSRFPSKA